MLIRSVLYANVNAVLGRFKESKVEHLLVAE